MAEVIFPASSIYILNPFLIGSRFTTLYKGRGERTPEQVFQQMMSY